MRLPNWMLAFIIARLAKRLDSKLPDQFIGGPDNPYLARDYILPRNRFFNIYHHVFFRSDDDRALHDHPWVSCSIILHGSYIEHSIAAGGVHHADLRRAGDVVFRRASAAHRLEVEERGTRTLFITGPRLRRWGFHCRKGWVHWKDFVDPTDRGLIGPGCGEFE